MNRNLQNKQLESLQTAMRARQTQLREEIRQALVKSDSEHYLQIADSVRELEDESFADLIVDVGLAEIDRDLDELRAIDAALLREIHQEGYAGGILFVWQDEWFKKTWNTMRFELPEDRRSFWLNVLTNESLFGVLGMYPGKEGVLTIDGDRTDWDQLKPEERQVLKSFQDRWEQLPPDRQDRLRRGAERWQQMTPQERDEAPERDQEGQTHGAQGDGVDELRVLEPVVVPAAEEQAIDAVDQGAEGRQEGDEPQGPPGGAGGSGGVLASLMSHSIAAPPIAALGSPDLQRRLLPRILSGEWIAALAITVLLPVFLLALVIRHDYLFPSMPVSSV